MTKRKPAVRLSTKNPSSRQRPRGRKPTLQQLQEHFALLLLLLQHNFDKALRHKRSR